MRVNDSNLNGIDITSANNAARTQQAENQAAAKAKGAAAGAGASDTVQLSSLGSHLQSLDIESPERAARVEALAQQVQSGAYQPDAAQVSRSIVNELLKG
ncbi:MAG: flagellar biosynthesis anti-sigma factor FlgM [Bryobacter sp.]|jgi:flagellar biosynthesis anti-sigma factor FlgM|nr:flagellar biosynthesis anti-sigma factor FlgM [Bryobacter sp.]